MKKAKQRNRKKIIFIISLLVIAFLILIILILQQSGIIQLTNSSSQKEKFSQIEDECNVIAGQLMHSISDSDACEMKCKAVCGIKSLDYLKSNLTIKENECNLCDCFCK